MADPKSGTIEVDSKVILVEVLEHMKKQNDHQVSQLDRGEAIIRQLQGTNRRVNVLVVAAVLLLGLGAVHQQKIDTIVSEQQAAQQRSVSLERSVDQKITTGTQDVVKKVEELGQTAPKVVPKADGTFSLSFPIMADTSVPLPEPTPAPSKPAAKALPTARIVGAATPKKANLVRSEAPGSSDRVELPLE